MRTSDLQCLQECYKQTRSHVIEEGVFSPYGPLQNLGNKLKGKFGPTRAMKARAQGAMASGQKSNQYFDSLWKYLSTIQKTEQTATIHDLKDWAQRENLDPQVFDNLVNTRQIVVDAQNGTLGTPIKDIITKFTQQQAMGPNATAAQQKLVPNGPQGATPQAQQPTQPQALQQSQAQPQQQQPTSPQPQQSNQAQPKAVPAKINNPGGFGSSKKPISEPELKQLLLPVLQASGKSAYNALIRRLKNIGAIA